MRDINVCINCDDFRRTKASDGITYCACWVMEKHEIPGTNADHIARKVPEKCPFFFEQLVRVQGHENDTGYGKTVEPIGDKQNENH